MKPKKKPLKEDGAGITAKWKFFASSDGQSFGKTPPQQTLKPADPETKAPDTAQDPDELLRQMLLENPNMNASTFYNTMKAKGLTVVKKPSLVDATQAPKEEADSGSTMSAQLRANPKKESRSSMVFRSRFMEALADNGPGATRFKAILIQEGLGNFRDGYYYTKEALASAVPLFEGKKVYADHPSSFEDQTRPERSVKDILGHFENVKLEEGADGQAMLTADMSILPERHYEWARSLMKQATIYAKKYPDKEFVGLSINANGNAEPMSMDEFLKETSVPESAKIKLEKAMLEGLQIVKVVSVFTDAVSCDLVTEAGAGGAIMQMLEQEKAMLKKEDESKKEAHKEDEAKKEAGDKKPAADGAQGSDDGDHADKDQDIALIKKMIADHLGGEHQEDEACQAKMKQAYESYKEMGYSEDEAKEAAGHAMKLAKHMASKEEESKESGDKPAFDADADDEKKKEHKEHKEDEAHKESAKIARLMGEVAKLREALQKTELNEYLDAKLKESKESRKVTDAFRDLVKGTKTKGEIDRLWESFKAGTKAAGASKSFDFSESLYVSTEKNTARADKSSISFGDFLK